MEDFVPFEIAKKLKEKGFREECLARYYCSDKAYFEENSYHPDTESVFYCYNNDEDLGRFYIDAPTISQVLKWLREEKKLHIVIIIWGRTWGYNIIELPSGCSLHWTAYQEDIKSYEDAAIAGIEYVLDNLI